MIVTQKLALTALVFQVVIIFLYGFCTEYSSDASPKSDLDTSIVGAGPRYAYYQDVHVMIFIGFGFLMSFLKKYTFGAIGFNYLVAAFTIEWAIISNGFWNCVYTKDWSMIQVNEMALINADFTAAAVLITFGALLGKVNPLQLFTILLIETFVYSLNAMIGFSKFGAADIGGSMIIHTFGAYFGLSCSLMLGSEKAKDHPDNSASKTSDTFAMIGTIFLWIFWPSFNAAVADGSRQERAVINTVLSIASSCLFAFAWSTLLRHDHKFCMVDIQNATLAGGVAMGASADMMMNPFGALLLGCIAAFISVFGFTYLQHFLQEKIGLHDSCGVNNLHGMPGILGGICSIITASVASESTYGNSIGLIFPQRAPSNISVALSEGLSATGSDRSASEQADMQLATLVVTLLLAISSGTLTGLIIKRPFFESPEELFDDTVHWEVDHEEGVDL